jgi:hypothetical protein
MARSTLRLTKLGESNGEGERIVFLNVGLRCVAGRSVAQPKLASEFLVPDGLSRANSSET